MLSRDEEPVDVRDTVPASSTLIVSDTVFGVSLTGLIVMVIVTVFPSRKPSLVLYVNISDVVSEPS